MKKTLSQIIKFCLLGTLIGCQEDKIVRPDWFAQGWGEVSVLQNGNKWANTGATALIIKNQLNSTCNGYLTIQFYKFSDDGYVRQVLQIDGVPPQFKGRYAVSDLHSSQCGLGTAFAGYFTSQGDGDVAKSAYSLGDATLNYLEITAYDSSSRRITGNFQLSFVKKTNYTNDDPVDVQFKSGQFTTPVLDKGRFQ